MRAFAAERARATEAGEREWMVVAHCVPTWMAVWPHFESTSARMGFVAVACSVLVILLLLRWRVAGVAPVCFVACRSPLVNY